MFELVGLMTTTVRPALESVSTTGPSGRSMATSSAPFLRPPPIGARTRLPVRSLFGARRRSALSTVGVCRVTTGLAELTLASRRQASRAMARRRLGGIGGLIVGTMSNRRFRLTAWSGSVGDRQSPPGQPRQLDWMRRGRQALGLRAGPRHNLVMASVQNVTLARRRRRKAEQNERETALEQREAALEEKSVRLEASETAANERRRVADERDRVADDRDRIADDRDDVADRREEMADAREERLNEQEDLLTARKQRLDERARGLGDTVPGDLQLHQDTIDRIREALERTTQRLARAQDALNRARTGAARDEAEIDREVRCSRLRGSASEEPDALP